MNKAVLDIIRRNSREPDMIGGDVLAELSSLEVGAAAIERVTNRFGAAILADAIIAWPRAIAS